MSVRAMAWAWEQPLPTGQKILLLALADFADEAGTCFPGQARLAAMTGQHEVTVRRNLTALEEAGLIQRQHAYRNDGTRTSDRYLVAFEGATVQDARKDYRAFGAPTTVHVARDYRAPCMGDEPSEEPPEEPSVAQPSAAKAQPAAGPRRLPADWQPTGAHRTYAHDMGISLSAEVANFTAYFGNGKGKSRRYKDWDRCFQNWMLRTVQNLQRDGKWQPRTRPAVAPAPADKPLTYAEICAMRDALDDEDEGA